MKTLVDMLNASSDKYAKRIASFKVPKYVDFRQSLPKNATGKILKKILREAERNNAD